MAAVKKLHWPPYHMMRNIGPQRSIEMMTDCQGARVVNFYGIDMREGKEVGFAVGSSRYRRKERRTDVSPP
jgi:hypothetical protein